jgi:hypothetical protein
LSPLSGLLFSGLMFFIICAFMNLVIWSIGAIPGS